MKKTTVLFMPRGIKIFLTWLCVAMVSMACLESAAVPQGDTIGGQIPAVSATESIVPTATLTLTPALSLKGEGVRCARVIASDALNLRMEASEQSRILAWLKNNDIVVVVDASNADWWYVESPLMSGYVRSVYLQESECVK